jgi:hypothetical protein
MTVWTKNSGSKLAILQERITTTVNLPVADGATVTLHSGELPKGMRLNGTILEGTPFEVPRNTTYRFVLRGELEGVKQDRTYSIEVQGPDAPEWVTAEDLLPIGNNQSFFILDSTPVEYQLQVIDRDTSSGQRLVYFIGSGGGELPPGITLTRDGKLVGVVDPVLALEKQAKSGVYDENNFDRYPYDFSVQSAQGYDSFYYDVTIFDYATPTQVPKKLNRYYQFTVSVTDGDTTADRTFRIFVVGDDFLRADNTIMQIGTGVFSADATPIRTPIWLTPSDLGFRRANNYITLFLDIIDPNSLLGVNYYELLDTNDDNTPSELPPGMSLDEQTGEVSGKVPYQPAVTREYKFTINAVRVTGGSDERAETKKTFKITLLGEVNSNINWVTNGDLGEINSNYISTLSVVAKSDVPEAFVLYSLESGRLPPGLELAYDGEIVGKINSFGSADSLGLTVFDSANLVLDGNTTSVDREYEFTVRAQDHFGYSSITKTFKISVSDPDDKLYSNIYFKPLLKQDQRTTFNEFVTDPAIFPPENIYRPNDPEFGLTRDIKLLVYSGIETKLAEQYVAATALATSRKNYKISNLKTAVAKTPGTNDIIYEVVYLEVVDPYERDGKVAQKITIKNNSKFTVDSVRATPKVSDYDTSTRTFLPVYARRGTVRVVPNRRSLSIGVRSGSDVEYNYGTDFYAETRSGDSVLVDLTNTPANNLAQRPAPAENTVRVDSNAVLVSDPNKITKYISNISNVRTELSKLGRTERNFLPLWMRTAQEDSIQELGYTLSIPLCFCKPGTSETIKAAIEFSGFDYRQFELDIDRFLIDSTEGIGDPKYFVFANYEFNI